MDTPYTGSWNSSHGQHLSPDGGPDNVNVDNDDYLLPTSLDSTRDT